MPHDQEGEHDAEREGEIELAPAHASESAQPSGSLTLIPTS